MLQVATATLALALAASPSAGSAYLKEARTLYDSQDYDACLGRIEQARKATVPGEEAQVEFVGALCSSQLGKFSEAESLFRLALRIDRTLVLPNDVSPKVRSTFEKAKAAIEKEQAQPPPVTVDLEPSKPPTEPPPVVVVKPPETPSGPLSASAWVAIGSGSATAVSGAVAVIFGVLASNSAASAATAPNDVAFGQTVDRARGQQATANVAWGITAALAVATAVATGAALW